MLGSNSGLALALCLFVLASAADGLETPRKAGGIDAPDSWISGKWYHAVSCPAWSGRYVFHIRWLPGGALEGASEGISFGATGHSSEIVSGKVAEGAFELIERSDKGFLA
ncbi:MAG: hypothetical protein AAGF20_12010 [Pseudomonadota bacterium]